MVGLEFGTAGSALSFPIPSTLERPWQRRPLPDPPAPRRAQHLGPGPDVTSATRIAILKADHREVERLFKAFEKTSDRAHVERRTLVDSMIEELSRHAAIEEQIVYPWAR